jgi:hypothetical protein
MIVAALVLFMLPSPCFAETTVSEPSAMTDEATTASSADGASTTGADSTASASETEGSPTTGSELSVQAETEVATTDEAVATAQVSTSCADVLNAGAGKVFTIHSRGAGGHFIDIAGGSTANCANAQLYSSNSTPSQRFWVSFVDEGNGLGHYVIKNVNSGKALDCANGGKVNGTNVRQYTANDTAAQSWVLTESVSGYYTIMGVGSGLMLDVKGGSSADGANLQLYEGNGTAAQDFAFDGCETDLDGSGSTAYILCSSVNEGRVLDVSSGSTDDAANVQLWAKNWSDAQRWSLNYDASTGYYEIVNANANKALDVFSGGTAWGTNIDQYTRNNTTSQRWSIKKGSDGSYTLTSARNGLVVDLAGGTNANGTNYQCYTANGTKAQSFSFASDGVPGLNTHGLTVYNIQSSRDSKAVLDIANGSKDAGANVQLYQANASDAQRFKTYYDESTKTYKIINVNSGKALDVQDASKKNGANIQQCTSWDGAATAQRWTATMNSDGSYTLESLCNGLVIDAAGGSTANGTNIQCYTSNGSAAQKWNFVKADDIQGLPNVATVDASWSSDSGYVSRMRSRAESTGSSTQWYFTLDKDSRRVCVFRRVSGGWQLTKAFNSGIASNVGVHQITHTKRANWDNGIGLNDWFTVFVDCYLTGDNYVDGDPAKGRDDGQGFHATYSLENGDVASWYTPGGCAALAYNNALWIYELPDLIGSTVDVF